MSEPDDFNDCDCSERVPAILPPEGWICSKCDAQWWPETDEDDQ